jgi:transcriptional regulator with XRE-family HTH domain
MQPDAYRKSVSLSQAQFAEALGVCSKGYISRLERGRQAWPLKLALTLENLSEGQVSALTLVDAGDAALLKSFAAREAARSEPRLTQDELVIGGHA